MVHFDVIEIDPTENFNLQGYKECSYSTEVTTQLF